jgi:y4mF family transcriptional regulator
MDRIDTDRSHAGPTPEQFGFALRVRRGALGLTQQDLADVIGVNRRVIGELERGKRTVRFDIALEAARALGFDVELHLRR